MYFWLIMSVFFLAVLQHVLLVMGRFVCNLNAYSAHLQYMEDTGRSKIR